MALLITYDDEVQLLAPLAPVDPDALLRVIASIPPGGQTNLSGGWLKGVEELGRASGEGPRKVLLLTDGLANVGISDPAALTAMARETAGSAGVGTTSRIRKGALAASQFPPTLKDGRGTVTRPPSW